MKKLKVAVLMGGTSNEREISLSTGRQIMAALDPDKYTAIALDAATINGALPGKSVPQLTTEQAAITAELSARTEMAPMNFGAIIEADKSERPDVVFIALHGRGGEDGTVQGLLELLGIPYTGSGVLASALAMDKAMTKRILRGEGIPVAGEIVLRRAHGTDPEQVDSQIQKSFGYPVVVKPNSEGSTIGCSIVHNASELAAAMGEAFKFDATVMVEQFLKGAEITVGLLGNEQPVALPAIEIVPQDGFYDYKAKYAAGGSKHIIPARLSELATRRAAEYAVRTHQALGCRGMSRVDMIVDGDQPYVLESNTIPGMTPTSLLPDAAKHVGIGFTELLDRIIASALTP